MTMRLHLDSMALSWLRVQNTSPALSQLSKHIERCAMRKYGAPMYA